MPTSLTVGPACRQHVGVEGVTTAKNGKSPGIKGDLIAGLFAEQQLSLVRSRGLEPPRLAALPPQGSASTNSAMTAHDCSDSAPTREPSFVCGALAKSCQGYKWHTGAAGRAAFSGRKGPYHRSAVVVTGRLWWPYDCFAGGTMGGGRCIANAAQARAPKIPVNTQNRSI
jgi:hypothetical protein